MWVGGQLVISLIVRPVAVRTLDDQTRRETITAMGAVFGRLALWGLFPLLLATGLALSFHRGVEFGQFRVPGYGAVLSVKVILAMASFALAGIHGMVAARSGGAARAVGITGAVVSVVVVLLAVTLAF